MRIDLDLNNILSIIEQGNIGESHDIEFKLSYIEDDKLAQIVLAMANTLDSEYGLIIFGVKDINGNGDITGIDNIRDESDIRNSLDKWIPENLVYEIKTHKYNDKQLQIILVKQDNRHIPYLPKSNKGAIKKNTIYVRHGTKTEIANQSDIESMVARKCSEHRIKTLDEHIKQLSTLYSYKIDKNSVRGIISSITTKAICGDFESELQKDIDKFIEIKRGVIIRELQ